MAKRIGIIGSGASGITAIKECLDEGFDVVCFEKGTYLGGLWRYHENDEDGIASVMRSTIINSSKEMSAYSDFPPPQEFANYMHNSLMIKYIEMYAEQAGVERYVRFNHEVIKLIPNDDYEKTGKWKIRVKNKKLDTIVEDVFDGVMVCTGHHVKPISPTFPGQDSFKGQIVHTHSYKKADGFDGKNVVVVGVGNSGGDAAVELSMVAKKVYWSTRRGCWMLYRVGPSGEPFDSTYLRRFWDTLFKWSPYSINCSMAEGLMNQRFDHKKYGLKPKHRIFGQHPMVNDALPNRILSGTVIIKSNIKQFTEDGILFEGEKKVTPVEAVILATGYEVCFPFLDESILWTESNKVELYKYMFNPKMRHPHALAFIGLIQAVGPAIPVSEMQSRWFVHLMAGKSKLPSVDKMMADIDIKRKEIAGRYFEGPRHTMQIDWIPFMDEIADQFGAKPNLLKYFLTDPQLWYNLFFGPCYPYQYRLEGPHPWPGARKAILEGQKRIDAPFNTREDKVVSNENSVRNNGHHHVSDSVTGKECMSNILFVLLSYFPHLVKGAKLFSIAFIVLLFSVRLFPSLFGYN